MYIWIVILWIIATHYDQIQGLWMSLQSIDYIEEDDEEEEIQLPVHDTDWYCKQKMARWVRSFSKEESDVSKWNVNIDPIFYDRALLKKVWESPHNALEAQWKRRFLCESTPRGNIIMHYDAYREGFVYYSDQSSLPYCILNAVAMKYVLLFRCRDFFIDETVEDMVPEAYTSFLRGSEATSRLEPTTSVLDPASSPKSTCLRQSDFGSSPMIHMLHEEERAEQDKKKQSMSHLLQNKDTSSGPSPFVQYRSKQPDAGTQPTSSSSSAPLPSLIKNKFVCMGKLRNWTPLQPPPRLQSKKTNMTSSTKTATQYDDFFSEPNIAFVPILPSKESLNYKSYKHQIAKV
jgi:hypothetical protein